MELGTTTALSQRQYARTNDPLIMSLLWDFPEIYTDFYLFVPVYFLARLL